MKQVNRIRKNIMRNRTNKPETLCFRCGNSCGGCSWSDRFEPVKNWIAEPTKIYRSRDDVKEIDSYHVIACPLFQADKQNGPKQIHPDSLKPFLYAILISTVRDYAKACRKIAQRSESDDAVPSKRVAVEIESYVRSPIFEDIVDALELCVSGPQLLEIIRNDPKAVLDRLYNFDREEPEKGIEL